jgi:phosphoglycolate phosphatase
MDIRNKSTILWDWNGTLLNDTEHCIRCMNILLKNRNLPPLPKERYLNIFTFPVIDYYKQLGFDFAREKFEIPAEEFIYHYNIDFESVSLFDDALEILYFFHSKGFRQYIISAMQHDALVQSVEQHKIQGYFEKITGIEDNFAFGKTAIANKLIAEMKIDPTSALFIGDTLHDAEVAAEINVDIVLISNGHQHHSRLINSGTRVFTSLRLFREYITR